MKYSDLIDLPVKGTYNKGLISPKNADMLEYFGHPVEGGAYDKKGKCLPPNNVAFKKRLETANVGPFNVTGLTVAIDSLRAIFARVEKELPELYPLLRSNGMLCSRFTKINGKIGPNISNHTWGTALDMYISGEGGEESTERQGDNKVQRGLLILSSYFNAAGWYWGAAFPVEDGMHFEVSKNELAEWKQAGLI